MEGIFLFRDSGFNSYIELYYISLRLVLLIQLKLLLALENAASIAGMLLTTECVIADRPKKDEANGNHGAPDMGGMGGY